MRCKMASGPFLTSPHSQYISRQQNQLVIVALRNIQDYLHGKLMRSFAYRQPFMPQYITFSMIISYVLYAFKKQVL